jgi:hypothetical protein
VFIVAPVVFMKDCVNDGKSFWLACTAAAERMEGTSPLMMHFRVILYFSSAREVEKKKQRKRNREKETEKKNKRKRDIEKEIERKK